MIHKWTSAAHIFSDDPFYKDVGNPHMCDKKPQYSHTTKEGCCTIYWEKVDCSGCLKCQTGPEPESKTIKGEK